MISREVQITPQDDAWPRLMAKRLAEALDPDQIYLFGSRARGDFYDSSDYDFMVIMPDVDYDVTDLHDKAAKTWHGSGIFADVKIEPRQKFVRQLHLKASMPSVILREGILLYSRQGLPANYIPTKSPASVREESEEEKAVRIENTKLWVNMARVDIKTAKLLINQTPDCLSICAYHCQQATEKILKAFLTWHDHPARKVHELGPLREECCVVDASLESSLPDCGWLTEWNVLGRYTLSANEQLAQEALSTAEVTFQLILDRLPSSVQ
jgi:uncharacterized protein